MKARISELAIAPFNAIFKLFLWASGADLEILDQAPTDKNKYYGIGGTIVFTALMASFAGGYAFFTAFKDTTLSIFFGLFWGALIFNLDRYIVSTFGVGDGKRSISRQEVIEAFPRLLMAIILGFVISTPLELKIFEKEIKTTVNRLKIEKKEAMIAADSTFYNDINKRKQERDTINNELNELRNNQQQIVEGSVAYLNQLKQQHISDKRQVEGQLQIAQNNVNRRYQNYINAKRDTTGRFSQGQINSRYTAYRNAIDPRDKLRNDLSEIEDKITQLENDKEAALREQQAQINQEIALLTTRKTSLENAIIRDDTLSSRKQQNYQQIVDSYDGFAAHLEALGKITEEDSSIFYAKWLITLLFIFIEIAPILFKMMTERGPYDDILDRVKHEAKVNQLLLQSNMNQEINTAVKINAEKTEQKLNAELLANKELLESIAKAQAEIAKVAIESWKKEQVKRVKENPTAMIKSKNKK